MTTGFMLLGIAVMSGVTWAIRMIPLAVVRKKFKNRYFLSLLYYLPYGVLSAMIFPAVFSSCGSIPASSAGAGVALILSFFRAKLIVVAAAAVITAWMVGMMIG